MYFTYKASLTCVGRATPGAWHLVWMGEWTHAFLLALFAASTKNLWSDQDLDSTKLCGYLIFADHFEIVSHVVAQG